MTPDWVGLPSGGSDPIDDQMPLLLGRVERTGHKGRVIRLAFPRTDACRCEACDQRVDVEHGDHGLAPKTEGEVGEPVAAVVPEEVVRS